MSYVIIGMFKDLPNAENAKARLLSSGCSEDDVQLSSYKRDKEVQNDRGITFREDEKTKKFWDYLFGEEKSVVKDKYAYAASRNHMLVAYTETEMEADKIRLLMNDAGACSVDEVGKEYFTTAEPGVGEDGLTEAERSRVLAKARYGVYMTGERQYTTDIDEGMITRLDSQGQGI